MSSGQNLPLSGPPLISCVMAVNKDNPFLEQAIESILCQSYSNFEFLIIANACTDEFWDYLKSFSDSRIRLFRSSIGQLQYNLNIGIDNARGEFIARMDADDISLPTRFEKQVAAFLNSSEEVGLVATSWQTIDKDGALLRRFDPPTSSDAIYRELCWNAVIAHPTVMIRREALLRLGGYAYSFIGEDYDLWLRMRRSGVRFCVLPEVLFHYRIHENQLSGLKNFSTNAPYVVPLFIREFFLTKNPMFLAGLIRYSVIAPLYRWVCSLFSSKN